MIRRPPVSTRTDTLFPYTTLFRSLAGLEVGQVVAKRQIQQLALPAKQSVVGIELAGIFRIGWRVVGQVRRVFDFWHGGRGRWPFDGRCRSSCRLRTGQWLDALQPCPADVHGQAECRLLRFYNLLGTAFGGIDERDGGALGDQGGLEQHQFLEPEALPPSSDVVDDRGGEFLGDRKSTRLNSSH